MVIRLDENYNAMTSTALLGYVGETNARPVSVEGMEIDGADRYVLTIDYGDGVAYEVDITGGQWTPTADILRSAQTVSCQIAAKKLSGDEYVLVKKSRIFRLRIGAAIGDNAVPSPSVATDALDRIDAIGRQAHADMQTEADKTITAGYAKTAKTCADSTTADRQAVQEMAEQVTVDKTTVAENATKVAEDRTAAEAAAQKAQSVADSLPEDYVTAVAQIAKNTAEIANVKLTDKELQRRVNALYDMGNGVTHKFETDSETAYQKTIPTGAKLMSVKSVGGHSEVIDGEIVSAGTESVVEQGKNLFDYTDKTYHGTNVSKVENGVIYTKQLLTTILNIPTIVGNKYTLSLKTKSISTSQGILRWSLQKGKNTAYADDSSLIKKVVGTVANTEYQETVTFTATTDFVSLCGLATAFYDVQLEESDAATDYSPFYQTEYLIPEAIKALPGYGWSAGTAKNWVDYENKKYYQCVDSVDLGTLTWENGESVSFETHELNGQKLTKSYGIAPNFVCPKYSTKTQNAMWGKTSITGITANANVDGYVYVNDTSYTDATAFKQAMSGVILYYELASPIVTDISTLIPDDFLRNIEIEAGGSVTFKNSNGDSYRIPVPSEEEYIVKLSEIGGTT